MWQLEAKLLHLASPCLTCCVWLQAQQTLQPWLAASKHFIMVSSQWLGDRLFSSLWPTICCYSSSSNSRHNSSCYSNSNLLDLSLHKRTVSSCHTASWHSWCHHACNSTSLWQSKCNRHWGPGRQARLILALPHSDQQQPS